ncbi:MAG: RHS repeat-associated core domain-containing protein [Bacteroidota bacterium]
MTRAPLCYLGILTLLLIAGSVVAQPVVTTTTTTTYDPETLLPKTVTVVTSDGGYQQIVTTYEHETNAAMEGLNMVSQPSVIVAKDEAGTDVACTRTTWTALASGGYVPERAYFGCGTDEVESLHYAAYDARGRLIEAQDAAGLTTTVFYGAADDPATTSVDERYTNDVANHRVTGLRREMSAVYSGQPVPMLEEAYDYDNRARLVAMTDASGHATRFSYDGLGRLDTTFADKDADGAGLVELTAMEYVYSAEATGTYDPANPNRVSTTVFTSNGSKSKDQVATAFMDGLGREIQTQVVRSATHDEVTVTEYDDLGRPWRTWRPVVSASGGAYMMPGTFKTDAEGYYQNAEGNGTGADNRPFTETTYTPDPTARASYVRDPGAADEGVTMSYGVDEPDAATGGAGWIRRPEYDAAQPLYMAYAESVDADGRTSRTYTDGLGRERFVRAGIGTADETLTEFRYDAAGRVVEVRHPTYFRPRAGDTTVGSLDHKRASRTTYDTRGLAVRQETPDAGNVRMLYDESGRLIFSQDAEERRKGEIHFYTYDELGRMRVEGIGQPSCTWETLDPAAPCPKVGETTGSFTSDGTAWIRMLIHDDPADDPYNLPPSHPDYDPNEIRVEGWPWYASAEGMPLTFENAEGKLAAEAYRSDGLWQATFYSYDDRGRVAQQRTRTDAVSPQWETVDFTYDRAGQVTRMDVAVGSESVSQLYIYDRLGRVIRTRSRTSDGTTVPPYTEDFRATYRAGGAVQTLYYKGIPATSAAHRVDYAYRIEGWLHEIGNVDATAPAAVGKPIGAGDAAPYAQRMTYTPAGLISGVEVRSPYAVLNSPYTDVPGAQSASWSYALSYDALARLTGATWAPEASGGGLYSAAVTGYDANGNILGLQRFSPSGTTHGTAGVPSAMIDDLTYAYADGKNRLLSVADAASGFAGVAWDAEGSTFAYNKDGVIKRVTETASGVKTLDVRDIDERDLPTWVKLPGGVSMYYRYSASGLRITERTSGGVGTDRRFVRVGSEVVGVFTATGTLEHWNLAGIGSARGREEADGTRYYVYTDHLGSTRAVVDEGGNLSEARDHYPFGLQMPGRVYVQGSPTREDFTGHELDQETGLLYARARYYHAALGRWMSVDPLGMHSNQIDMSPYMYSWGDPIGRKDENGMCPNCLGGAIAGFVTDIAIQYVVTGEVDLGQAAIAAGAGAMSGGLSTARQLGNVARYAAGALIDGGASATVQYAKEGEVNLADTAADVAIGQAARRLTRSVNDAALESSEARVRSARTTSRKANNAAERGGRTAGRSMRRSASAQDASRVLSRREVLNTALSSELVALPAAMSTSGLGRQGFRAYRSFAESDGSVSIHC